KPSWSPRSARRWVRTGSVSCTPLAPGSASRRRWPPSATGAAPAPQRPDPWPLRSGRAPRRVLAPRRRAGHEGVSEPSVGVADRLVEDRQAERKLVLAGGQWRGDPQDAPPPPPLPHVPCP